MEESNKYLEVKAVRISVGRKRLAKLFGFLLLSVLYLLHSVSSAQAASLFLSPETGSFNVGQTFSVSVFVSSPDQTMNAAEGVISFPANKLQVISLSKSASIFSLWVKEPSFSNSVGTLSFEGVVLNPGFAGSAGRLLTITFRAEDAGSTPVNFSSGSVLANDGKGTNILNGFGSANYFLEGARQEQPLQEETPPTGGVPAAPRISSPTHPDSNKWYSRENAKFVWPLPGGITGARVLFGRLAQSTPTVAYVPAVDSKEVGPLNNGIWYFHVQLQNQNGWGSVGHMRFQIDLDPPSRFDIQEVARTDLTDPKVKFTLNASDAVSGIDHYEIQMDDRKAEIWKDDGTHTYETPVQGPGNHAIKAKAVDKAGNFLEKSQEFTINALRPPTITEYPKLLQAGEPLIVKGLAEPSGLVVIWFQREADEVKRFEARSNGESKFTFTTNDRLKPGTYALWAEVVDDRGAKSTPSDKVIIKVEQGAFLKIGSFLVNALSVIIPLIALLALLILLLWYSWHRLRLLKRKIRREMKETEVNLKEAFSLLRHNIRKQIRALEKIKSKRQLTKEEQEILEGLEQTLDEAEGTAIAQIDSIIEDIK